MDSNNAEMSVVFLGVSIIEYSPIPWVFFDKGINFVLSYILGKAIVELTA